MNVNVQSACSSVLLAQQQEHVPICSLSRVPRQYIPPARPSHLLEQRFPSHCWGYRQGKCLHHVLTALWLELVGPRSQIGLGEILWCWVIFKCAVLVFQALLLLLLQFHRMWAEKDEHGCQWSVICSKPSLANCEALRCDHRDAEHLQLPQGQPVNYTTLSTLSNDMCSVMDQRQK